MGTRGRYSIPSLYYYITPLFVLLDYGWGISVRVAVLDSMPLYKNLYYGFCILCGVGASWCRGHLARDPRAGRPRHVKPPLCRRWPDLTLRTSRISSSLAGSRCSVSTAASTRWVWESIATRNPISTYRHRRQIPEVCCQALRRPWRVQAPRKSSLKLGMRTSASCPGLFSPSYPLANHRPKQAGPVSNRSTQAPN